jgi:glucose-6-phosphate dehydrogenase assembly protein OpcA
MGVSHNIPPDVSAIERELRRQWQEQPFSESVVRTRTLNLVIVSRREPVPPEMIAQLTETHPGRAIAVDLSADIGSIGVHVVSSCVLTHTGANCLAREEVRLHTPLEVDGQRLESMVASLLVPGLPTFLWWRGEPDVDNPLLIRVSAHCDRMVVDSADNTHPWSGLAALHRAISGGRLPAVTDLAWSRITAWRELTAQFFDSRQCAQYVPHIRQARIVDLSGSDLSSDSFLFAAWVTRQLGWHPIRRQARHEEHRIEFRRTGKTTCEIQFTSHRGTGRGLQSVQLIAPGREEATFSIERTADAAGLITTIQLGAQPQVRRTVRNRQLDLAEMLGRELSSASHDALYEQVLSVAADIVGTGE